MSKISTPTPLSAFNRADALERFKNRVATRSQGRWTDTSNTNPGVVLADEILIELEELYARADVRFLPDAMLIHIASAFLGIQPAAAATARGMLTFTVTAGTNIPAGYQVMNPETGQVYVTRSEIIGLANGTISVEAEAVTPGENANVRDAGIITTLRGPQLGTVTTGTVQAVTNSTPFTGGTENESIQQFLERLPARMKMTRISRPDEYQAFAESITGVGRAQILRATTPTFTNNAITGFGPSVGSVTVIVVSSDGGAPAPSILTQIKQGLLERSLFTIDTNTLFVIPIAPVNLNIAGTIEAATGYTLLQAQNAARAAIKKYLHPLTGNQDGNGYPLGRTPKISELMSACVNTNEVQSAELSMTIASPIRADQILNLNTASFA